MSTMSKIALVREMIDSAETSLRSAKQLLSEVTGDSSGARIRAGYASAAQDLGSMVSGEGKIIEGVFNGRNFVGSDKREYPVPVNYASKSKLIPGDVMKLTIGGDGSFVYKQIGPVERKRVVGPLTQEDEQYKVIANGHVYKVLLASVTFYRAEAGDEVVLLVPAIGESEWGAIDNVIPKLQAEIDAEEKFIKEAKKVASETDPTVKDDDSFMISDEIDLDQEQKETKEKEEEEKPPKKVSKKKKKEEVEDGDEA